MAYKMKINNFIVTTCNRLARQIFLKHGFHEVVEKRDSEHLNYLRQFSEPAIAVG